ncbi:MAG: ABC transporter substrate-binding protein, partial [Fretibacterium sp.]|nr:ABC transporter substrate-binding protein [Fretibacterium sp.]
FPSHIVSLSPAGTEILFMLGLGERLAGVTEFCDYPPEALKKPRLGGFTEVNLESLVSSGTDLLVLQDIHRHDLAPKLDSLGIPYYILSQESTEDVCKGILELGELCGAAARARDEVLQIRARLEAVKRRVEGLVRPRVLICVSRELTLNHLETLYVAGASGNFYNELLQLAGGVNAVETDASYLKVSQEGVMKLNPDVILDLVGEQAYYHAPSSPEELDRVFDDDYLLAPWLRMTNVKAVQEGRVHLLRGTVFLRPGPRLPQIVEAFAQCLHPLGTAIEKSPASRDRSPERVGAK